MLITNHAWTNAGLVTTAGRGCLPDADWSSSFVDCIDTGAIVYNHLGEDTTSPTKGSDHPKTSDSTWLIAVVPK